VVLQLWAQQSTAEWNALSKQQRYTLDRHGAVTGPTYRLACRLVRVLYLRSVFVTVSNTVALSLASSTCNDDDVTASQDRMSASNCKWIVFTLQRASCLTLSCSLHRVEFGGQCDSLCSPRLHALDRTHAWRNYSFYSERMGGGHPLHVL